MALSRANFALKENACTAGQVVIKAFMVETPLVMGTQLPPYPRLSTKIIHHSPRVTINNISCIVYDEDISLFLRKFNGKRFKIVKVVFSIEIFKSLNLERQEPMTRVVMGSSGR